MEEKVVTLEKIVNLCKSRGFVYQGSEIYGGLANTWDFGPVGVEMLKNIKNAWWKVFVQENDNSYGIDCSILMNPRVWEASGHVGSFTDPKMDCKECKTRHRADNLIESYARKNGLEMKIDTLTNEEMQNFIAEKKIKCPVCGKSNFTEIRNFNVMFETSRGVIDGDKSVVYLRPETAQGQYINFLNVQRSTRAKIPFGIAQIGKAFRNEITPGNFLFRVIEFEQMEHQLFCKEGTDEKFFDEYKQKVMDFYMRLGIPKSKLRFKDHDKLAHYAKAATDIQFLFPMGWEELNGIHNRTNYDLTRHQEFSGKNMNYTDPITNEKYIPYVVEFSVGVGRLFLTLLINSYEEELLENDTRVVLHLHPAIAPYKVAILPLQKNLSERAREVYRNLAKHFACDYDEAGSIGKRYRRQDEIGTPLCVTVDFDTLENETVTIRDRDSMEQIRIKIDNLKDYVQKIIEF